MKMKMSIVLNYVVIILLLSGLSSCNFKANKEYKKAIESADAQFDQKKYNDAKKLYTKALELKPEEEYPKGKIAEIKKIFAKIKAQKYKAEIKKADDLFSKKSYNEAKTVYLKASEMKPKEQYPKEKIKEIDKLLAEIKLKEEYMNYPYHIVIGCFMVESNAGNLNKKLKAEGQNSRIIKMPNGRFDAVTLASFPTLTDAYNKLQEAKNEYGEESWVYKH
jgi:tetratricopeptide (TPR) repeat protein